MQFYISTKYMNIRTRINARKVALSYIYQHCFFWNLIHQKSAIDESLFIDNIFQTQTETFAKEKKILLAKIEEYHQTPFEDHVEDFVENFFNERTNNDIDFDYLLKVVPTSFKLESELKEQVNKYAISFSYDDMDTIDRSLFLLWYAEWKSLKTPKEVIINELIEIAKRYSDEWAPKLLNWIMHKIID